MEHNQTWEYIHFEQYGIEPEKESLCFYVDGDYIVYEINDESVLYDGVRFYRQKAGELVLAFANMRMDSGAAIEETIEKIKRSFPIKGKEQYRALYTELCKRFSPVISMSLTYQYFGSDRDVDFWLFLDTATRRCKAYIDDGILYLNDGAKFDATLIRLNENGHEVNRMYYEASGFNDIVSFDVYRVIESNILIKRCKLCGKAFIPTIRSDELYCQNIYKNNRTCAEVAFEMKSKEDPFYTAYRNAYKAKSGRVARMVGGGSRAMLTAWRQDAKEKMEDYRTKGDIEGYLAWLKEHR